MSLGGPYRRNWEELTAAEKISYIERKREMRRLFSDPEVKSAARFFTEERKKQKRIDRHVAAILKLRNAS